jgi:DNA-binding transcriptional regulator YiaG
LDSERGHRELEKRIASADLRSRLVRSQAGAMRAAVPVLASLAACVFVDALLPLAPAVRVGWLGAVALLAVLGAALWVARPFARRVDAVRVAAAIEREHPELGEALESATELWSKRGAGRTGYSVELIDALIARVVAATTGVAFSAEGDLGERRRWSRGLAVAALASTVALASLGGRLGPALGRLASPMTAPAVPVITLTVLPGDTTVIAGDDLTIDASVAGPAESPPVLRLAPVGEDASERAMARAGEGYRSVIEDLRTDLRYQVAVGPEESAWYRARVIERPFVTGIRLDYDFPDYSGLVSRTVDENSGDITALAGTRVQITVSASKPLERAWLDFEGGRTDELSRAGPETFEGEIAVGQNARYSIGIHDLDGLESPSPPVYSIVAIRDEYPLVRIVDPGEDREMPRDMNLPVAVSAVDDYGISRIVIRYAIEGRADEGVVPVADPVEGSPRDVEREFQWDLSETGILPGSVLVYFAEVADNDAVGGPKVARSESYVLRFPSMSELYQDVVGEQDDITEGLDELAREQKTLHDEFDEIRDEFRSDPSLDWQKEQRINQSLDRQESLADRVSDMADQMSDLSERMTESDRITLETLDKMQEISQLLDDISTDEMRDLLDQIRSAMSQLSPDEVSRAMEQTSMSQEDYLRRLEQTASLLRRVKAEQTLADLGNRASDLSNREAKLADQAGQNPPAGQCQGLSRDQQALAEEAAKLRRELEDAAREMEAVDRDAAAQMREAAGQMDLSKTLEKMQQAMKSFAEADPDAAMSSCQSAASDLLTLFTSLSSCQGGMSCSLQKRDRETTLRAVDELLGVSAEQEKVVVAVENRSRIPREEIVELVAKEADLIDAMGDIANRIFEASKESFSIDAQILRSFGAVQMALSGAASKIADGGVSAGHTEAERGLASLNNLIVGLLTANQSQSKTGGSALQQLMDQLRQMSEDQSQLMGATDALRRQLDQAGMGPDLDRQLAEIRGQQERLLEEARRLSQEFGDRKEILGSLDDTVAELEKAVDEMGRSGASQETINRQRRILSRLLDAQRSLRQRDYTEERRSRSGGEYQRESPGAVPEDLVRATEELREDLLRAMQHEYPPEYREMIRSYFEDLARDIGSGAR